MKMTEQTTGWRDISTAPKDGTYILLAAHDIYGHQDPNRPSQIVRGGYWIKLEGREGGVWSCGAFTTHNPPTHWQPLPPPPGEDVEDWYALGVKDGHDGCLVELDALQARCDKLEAAALDVLAHLTAAVSVIKTSEENGNHPSCAYGSDTMYRMAMKDFHKSMEVGRKALSNRSNEDE